MSHRTALALSIVLTLVLAIGILASRERLFTLGATASTTSLTSVPNVVSDGSDGALGEVVTAGRSSTSAAPRVIEIPLPVTEQVEEPRQGSEDERWERGDDRDDHDDDDHDRYEEHEGDDD